MKLKLRAAAERDLDGVFDYSVARHGPKAAETYLRDVQVAMERLLDHPGLGVEVGWRPKLRVLGVREHRVFYRVEDRTVVIARVLHKAMDVERHV